MQIGCVQLLEFRNYRTLSYRPDPRLNVLTGRNAQGKTNLLEALGVLLIGRSFRTSRLAELPALGIGGGRRLAASSPRSEGVRTVRRSHPAPGGRDLVRHRRDLSLGAGDRLRLAGPGHPQWRPGGAPRLHRRLRGAARTPRICAALVRYRRLVGQRNRLLQSRATARRGLAPWDEQLAAVGLELIDRRRRAVAILQTELARVYPASQWRAPRSRCGYRCVARARRPSRRPCVAALERARPGEMRRGPDAGRPASGRPADRAGRRRRAGLRLARPAAAAGPGPARWPRCCR